MTPSDTSTAFTSRWVAELVGAKADGPEVDGLSGLKGLDEATASDVTFLANPKYEAMAATTRARVLLAQVRVLAVMTGTVLLCDRSRCPLPSHGDVGKSAYKPTHSCQYLARSIHRPAGEVGLGADVAVAPLARIDQGATIGSGTVIHSQAFIGRDAVIGENVEIHPGAKVLERCQ